MRSASNRTGCFGRLLLLAGGAVLIGILWYSRQDRMERSLTRLGGEVFYDRGERATLLAERLQSATKGQVAAMAPQAIDRMFGKLVTVHFGRILDLRGIDPDDVVKAVVELPHLRTVVIDGIPMRDPHLLRLMEAPRLTELGLKNTEVTAAGVESARAKRPNVEIKWLESRLQ